MISDTRLRKQLGKTFVDRMIADTILSIGREEFSRDRLVREARCGNFVAAKRLGKVLKDLDVRTPADLDHLILEELAKVRGVGEATVYVLLCIQDALRKNPARWDRTWRTMRIRATRKPKTKKVA